MSTYQGISMSSSSSCFSESVTTLTSTPLMKDNGSTNFGSIIPDLGEIPLDSAQFRMKYRHKRTYACATPRKNDNSPEGSLLDMARTITSNSSPHLSEKFRDTLQLNVRRRLLMKKMARIRSKTDLVLAKDAEVEYRYNQLKMKAKMATEDGSSGEDKTSDEEKNSDEVKLLRVQEGDKENIKLFRNVASDKKCVSSKDKKVGSCWSRHLAARQERRHKEKRERLEKVKLRVTDSRPSEVIRNAIGASDSLKKMDIKSAELDIVSRCIGVPRLSTVMKHGLKCTYC